jgi:hypothetical protein
MCIKKKKKLFYEYKVENLFENNCFAAMKKIQKKKKKVEANQVPRM